MEDFYKSYFGEGAFECAKSLAEEHGLTLEDYSSKIATHVVSTTFKHIKPTPEDLSYFERYVRKLLKDENNSLYIIVKNTSGFWLMFKNAVNEVKKNEKYF